ncbi:MAG: hypothetical protein Q7S63_02035 [bacterium]|nr:hypothetical protein [bacterium]
MHKLYWLVIVLASLVLADVSETLFGSFGRDNKWSVRFMHESFDDPGFLIFTAVYATFIGLAIIAARSLPRDTAPIPLQFLLGWMFGIGLASAGFVLGLYTGVPSYESLEDVGDLVTTYITIRGFFTSQAILAFVAVVIGFTIRSFSNETGESSSSEVFPGLRHIEEQTAKALVDQKGEGTPNLHLLERTGS